MIQMFISIYLAEVDFFKIAYTWTSTNNLTASPDWFME
jgi:hypothetical protein